MTTERFDLAVLSDGVYPIYTGPEAGGGNSINSVTVRLEKGREARVQFQVALSGQVAGDWPQGLRPSDIGFFWEFELNAVNRWEYLYTGEQGMSELLTEVIAGFEGTTYLYCALYAPPGTVISGNIMYSGS